MNARIGGEHTTLPGGPRAALVGNDALADGTVILNSLLSASRDHRESPAYHQHFVDVRVDAADLGGIKAWPMVVDEALRLLAPGGTLTLRARDSALLSIFALKHQLHQWGQLTLMEETRDPRGGLRLMLRNERVLRRAADLQAMSFGVITNATTVEGIMPFVDSVLAIAGLDATARQIVVCGPRVLGNAMVREKLDVTFVEEPDAFTDRGWITRKKNLVVQAARYETIVLCHDRYVVPTDFMQLLRAFGGDFDTLVPRQIRPDGARYPDWVTLGSAWHWGAPAMLHYDDWTPFIYINGGAIIAKVALLREIPWNDLVFWNQAEDVELTRRLQARGVVPRLARNVTLVSRSTRAKLMESFDSMPLAPTRYVLPRSSAATVKAPSLPLDTVVPLGLKWQEFGALHGLAYDAGWGAEHDALVLAGGEVGELVFRLPFTPGSHVLTLIIDATDGTPMCELDEVEVAVARASGERSQLTVVLPECGSAGSRRLRVRAASGLKLYMICVRPISTDGLAEQSGAPMPTDAMALLEAAERAIARTLPLWASSVTGAERPVEARAFDGSGVCLADVSLLTRGARRVLVVLPSDVANFVSFASVLAALKTHLRSDARLHVATDPSLLPLLHGWDTLPVTWTRYLEDAAYAVECTAAARALAPELLIHLAPVRTLATELLVLQVPALGVIGFSAHDMSISPDIDLHARTRYTRMLTHSSVGAEYSLRCALTLPEQAATLWPDPRGASLGAMAAESKQRAGARVLALLGDDPVSLASPRLLASLRSRRDDGWAIVGIGGVESYKTLQIVLADGAPGALNLGGRLDIAGIHAFLSRADVCMGGGSALQSLAALVGCAKVEY